ncbi:methyltransferase family protein [Gemmatimonadota bacterium]
MKLTLRDQRLRLAWLLVPPFLFFSHPSPWTFLVGAPLSALGLLLRGWAAGCILKDQVLALGGPYRFIRNPLFLGSFWLGLGVVIAGGSWPFLLLFLLFFAWSYSRTLRAEESVLAEKFGRDYREYRASVPGFVPSLGRRHSASVSGVDPEGFQWSLYFRNREWQAGVGAGVAFGFLLAKWVVSSR